jgi:hypothetical protein
VDIEVVKHDVIKLMSGSVAVMLCCLLYGCSSALVFVGCELMNSG